jgi:hypothetical protein
VRKDKHRQTDMRKLMLAFHNLEKASTNTNFIAILCVSIFKALFSYNLVLYCESFNLSENEICVTY